MSVRDEIVRDIIKARMSGDKEEEQRLIDIICESDIKPEEYPLYEQIYREGRIERNDLWDELDDRGIELYEKYLETEALADLYECYKYCAPHIRVWLSDDIEDLIRKGRYTEAYKKLCSKYPELIVKRIQAWEDTTEESNSVYLADWYWISRYRGDLSCYFEYKEEEAKTMGEYHHTIREIERWYRVALDKRRKERTARLEAKREIIAANIEKEGNMKKEEYKAAVKLAVEKDYNGRHLPSWDDPEWQEIIDCMYDDFASYTLEKRVHLITTAGDEEPFWDRAVDDAAFAYSQWA